MLTQLNGIVVVDKPAGQSSAQIVAKVKALLGVAKCGHAGTLDPFATGVLICCINQATRLAGFFLHGRKKYEAVLRLGLSTDTQDLTGQVVERQPVPEFTRDQLSAAFNAFEGPQLQSPPVYAALKHEGVPLYKLARQGKPVQKPARPVTIESLCMLDVQLPDVRFDITCSAGTYVRALCADIGLHLGCGGHLAQLRRTASSHFTIGQAISLASLKELADQGELQQVVVPMAEALKRMPAWTADEALIEHIRHGRGLTMAQIPTGLAQEIEEERTDGCLKIVDNQSQLKAVIQKSADGGTYNYCCVFH